MEIVSVFVTGANRGIGLEFVRQLVHLHKPPRYLFATYRDRNTIQALEDIQKDIKECKIFLIQMDITKSNEVKAAVKVVQDTVGEGGLSLLINNAGAMQAQKFSDITEENLLFHFRNNSVAPLLVVKEMLPLLQRAAAHHQQTGMSIGRAAVLTITSKLGSIAHVVDEGFEPFLRVLGYMISKASLNMAMRVVAQEVKRDGILVVNMCPGYVITDMSKGRGTIDVEESVSAMLQTFPLLNETHHGSFLNIHGMTIPF